MRRAPASSEVVKECRYVDAKNCLRVLSQLPYNLQIAIRAELDLIDRPAVELLHLGDHHFDRVDANRIVRQWNLLCRKAPQLPHRLPAKLAPQIVRRLIERAQGKRIIGQHRLAS